MAASISNLLVRSPLVVGWVQVACAAGAPSSIVIVSSVAGLRPAKGIGFYGSTKAALMHLTSQLAEELAPFTRVNSVAPAVVRTRFARPLIADEEQTVSRYPLGRLGEPKESPTRSGTSPGRTRPG